MRIKCGACGKSFDNEKYYGICPKCGAFTRAADPAQTVRDERSYNGREVCADTVEGNLRHQEEMVPGHRPSPFTILCISLCVLAVAATSVLTLSMQAAAAGESVNGRAEAVRYEAGELIAFENHTYMVHSAKTILPAGTEKLLPEGQKAVAVYLTASSIDGGSADPLVEVPYISFLNRHRSPVEAYQFRNYADRYGVGELLERYSLNYEEAAKGCFVYLVDEAAESIVFSIEEREERKFYDRVKKIHEVKLEIEENEEEGAGNE